MTHVCLSECYLCSYRNFIRFHFTIFGLRIFRLNYAALYLVKVSWQFKSPRVDKIFIRTVGPAYGRTNNKEFGSYNIMPRHFLWLEIKTVASLMNWKISFLCNDDVFIFWTLALHKMLM